MGLKDDFLRCIESYCRERGVSAVTLSGWMFKDSRALPRIQSGGSLTLRSYERCMLWLSSNWPDPLEWPNEIERPAPGIADEIASRPKRRGGDRVTLLSATDTDTPQPITASGSAYLLERAFGDEHEVRPFEETTAALLECQGLADERGALTLAGHEQAHAIQSRGEPLTAVEAGAVKASAA